MLADNEFQFTLSKLNPDTHLYDPVQTGVKNRADGSIPFADVPFTQADIGKTYTYIIREVAGTEGGMAYDQTVMTVTVAITDDGNGHLLVSPSYPDDTEFNNTYTAKGSFIAQVSKRLDAGGRSLKAGEFKFELRDAAGTVVLQASNNQAGQVVFPAIEYSQAHIGQDFTYTIKELPGTETNMLYSNMEVVVTVSVRNGSGNGQLSVTPSYPADTEFVNSYTAEGQWTPEVSKLLSAGGRVLEAGAFNFTLEGEGQSLTATNAAPDSVSGVAKVSFAPINYTHEDIGKTYTYTIREVAGAETGMVYDPMEVVVKVAITNGEGNGQLSVVPSYPADTQFDNSYTASGEWLPQFTKQLDAGGRQLADKEFAFTLSRLDPVTNKPTPVQAGVKNKADSSIPFQAINYTQADIGKTYRYTIHEVVPGPLDAGYEGGMTYDPMQVEVEVKVTNGSGNGQLGIEVSAIADSEFNNTYRATAQFIPRASKRLDAGGRSLAEGEFQFVLLNEANEKIGETSNSAADPSADPVQYSAVVFDAITYTEQDIGKSFIYTIKELPGSENGMQYDPSTFNVKVVVSNGQGNGKLGMMIYTPTNTQFANKYTASGAFSINDQIGVNKVLDADGRLLKADEFTFVLSKLNPATGLYEEQAQASNLASGKVLFDDLLYTQDDIGKTHTYQVRELAPSTPEAYMQYSDNMLVFTVQVSDAGEGDLTVIGNITSGTATFTNRLLPPPTATAGPTARQTPAATAAPVTLSTAEPIRPGKRLTNNLAECFE